MTYEEYKKEAEARYDSWEKAYVAAIESTVNGWYCTQVAYDTDTKKWCIIHAPSNSYSPGTPILERFIRDQFFEDWCEEGGYDAYEMFDRLPYDVIKRLDEEASRIEASHK